MFRRPAFTLVLVIAAFVAGLALDGRMRVASETPAAPLLGGPTTAEAAAALSVPQSPAAPLAAPAGLPDFSGTAARAVSGVVNISSLQEVRTRNTPFANDPFFQYFFGNDEDLFGSRSRRSLSLGSGVIVSADGYIVTNSHVVGDNVREISAVLPDKREVHGQIVGSDPMTDIAVIKIPASGLPVVPWGDSSRLKIGQWVLAIGSPFQLNQTVTLGIVSAVGRANIGVADYEDFIQTDAAINPGNSGGALVDARGELVGINTAIYSQSGGYQGVGFAVPSNLARRVFDELVKNGEVLRGSIGRIEVSTVTSQLAEQLGVGETRGAFVTGMYRNSPAYRAGLRPGDVIVAFNNQRVEDTGQLLRLVADATVGSTATVSVVREGKQIALKIPIEQGSRTAAR